jgi:NUMOD3 motif-containing protein
MKNKHTVWNKGLKGVIKHSEETKRKKGEASKGRPAWNKGKHLSQEQRTKISAANNGRVGQLRNGELNGMFGKRQTEATKLRISTALKHTWKQRYLFMP